MRIIAGKYRGRVFTAPKGLETRPTISRAREALFSIMGSLEGKVVVDCYAGSGALGLEALSRGATRVVFVESGKQASFAIRKNLATLGAEESGKVLECPVLRARGTLQSMGPFDWVLADPPWPIAQQALLEVLQATAGLLAPDGAVVVGHRADQPVELPQSSPLRLTQRRRWGDSGMSFFAPI
jgi:16S rRNA (guanine966-N2)-methyltransferase